MKLDQNCQSCGVKLTPESAGTNADQSVSHLYCRECFLNGRYTEPYISYRDMVKKWHERFMSSDMPWWKRYSYVIGYPIYLRTLARWRSRVVS